MMGIISDLNALYQRWIDIADGQMSDKYADGMYQCINDLGDVIDKYPPDASETQADGDE